MKYVNPYKNILKLDEEVLSRISDPYAIDEFEKGRYQVFIHTLGSGAAGRYLPKEVAFNLQIEPDQDDIYQYLDTVEESDEEDFWVGYEFAHEIIEEVGDEIAKELNEKTSLPGQYYMGYLESDGSFGLFYTWEKGDHPEIEDEYKKRFRRYK